MGHYCLSTLRCTSIADFVETDFSFTNISEHYLLVEMAFLEVPNLTPLVS